MLEQLGVKSKLRYMDTAIPVDPHNLLSTAGLTVMAITAGGDNPGGRYEAPLDNLSPPRQNNLPKDFDEWWSTPVVKDDNGDLFDRRGLVLGLAHKDGGAHVDPEVDAAYAALSRSNSLGWAVHQPGGSQPMPNPVLPSVRQIAFELERTLEGQLPFLLGDI